MRLVGVEPTTGKSPADFKPAAYANFATAAPGVYAQFQNTTRGKSCRNRKGPVRIAEPAAYRLLEPQDGMWSIGLLKKSNLVAGEMN